MEELARSPFCVNVVPLWCIPVGAPLGIATFRGLAHGRLLPVQVALLKSARHACLAARTRYRPVEFAKPMDKVTRLPIEATLAEVVLWRACVRIRPPGVFIRRTCRALVISSGRPARRMRAISDRTGGMSIRAIFFVPKCHSSQTVVSPPTVGKMRILANSSG